MDEEGDLSSARPPHGTHQGRNGASVPTLVVRKGLHPEQEGANGTDVTMGSMRSFGPLARFLERRWFAESAGGLWEALGRESTQVSMADPILGCVINRAESDGDLPEERRILRSKEMLGATTSRSSLATPWVRNVYGRIPARA
jgi:hypothetical protein